MSAIIGEAWKFNFDASRRTGLKVDVMSIVLRFVVSCAEAIREIFIAAMAIKKYFQCLIIVSFFSILVCRSGSCYSLTLLPLASSAETAASLRSASCLRLSILALSTTLLYVALALK